MPNMPFDENIAAEEAKYLESFKQNVSADENQKPVSPYAEFESPLGYFLRAKFDKFESDRQVIEQRWMKDLRQYRGEYPPEVLQKMDKNRSRAFFSLTRSKVRTISSRMHDFLMPVSSEKNWAIEITPVPELRQDIIASIQEQYVLATGMQITTQDLEKILNEEAKRRCSLMEREMDDQLAELKYREIIRKVVVSGNLFGTGVLKGPTVYTKFAERYLPGPGGEWIKIKIRRRVPYFEFVPVWDIYPDMTDPEPENMQAIFQRHVMPRHKVFKLAKREDFNGRAILEYLQINPVGDHIIKTHETELRNIARDDNITSVSDVNVNKYDILEFWGYLNTNELRDHGVEIPEGSENTEVFANVWLIGSLVIKAVISPVEGAEYLYHWYYYEKDDTSIFGEGIPAVMRDPQKLFNASIRAMVDNAAMSAGPIIEANRELLAAGEDPRKIFPFRVYVREGLAADATAPAIRVYHVKSYIREYMEMINMFMNLADDVTAIPRYMYGESNQVGGAGRTATGLSMLMGASNITLKDQVRNYDEGITKPAMKALYHWNMEFNPKEDIKGDYQVVAKGSSSLIAKEVQVENLLKFLQVTANPQDFIYTKRANIFKEFAKALDLDKLDIVEDQDMIDNKMKMMQEDARRREDFEMQLQMIKAKSGGHMDKSLAEGGRPSMERLSEGDLQSGQIPEVTY